MMTSHSKRKRIATAWAELNELQNMLKKRDWLRSNIREQTQTRVDLVGMLPIADSAKLDQTEKKLQMCMESERMSREQLQEDIAKGLPDAEIRFKIEALESEIHDLSTRSYTERVVLLGTPSVVEKMGLYKAQMQAPGQPLYDCCFPSDAQPPLPLALAHHVFGEFLDDFNNVTVPLDDELCNFGVELSFNVLGRMQKFMNELDFQEAFSQKLEFFLGRSVAVDVVTCRTMSNPISFVSDATVKADGKWTALGEIKLDRGNTLAQGLQSFAIYACSQDDETKLLPCFFIEVIAPIIRIGGFAFFEKVAWQPLTPFINGFYSEHDQTDMAMLCRAMRALRRGLTALDSYYRGAHPSINTISCKDIPYPLQGRHSKRIGNRLVFLVTLEDGEQRIFKYCRQYGEDVHRSWAEENLAPILYGCTQIAGGWWEVEMQYLADWRPCWFLLEGMHRAELQAAISTALEKALAIQIDSCPVAHGDMRPPNIMIKRDGGGNLDIKFIDFDWAGKAGVAKYPPFMNTDLQWHPGVGSGKVLQQAHDRWWMKFPIEVPLLSVAIPR